LSPSGRRMRMNAQRVPAQSSVARVDVGRPAVTEIAGRPFIRAGDENGSPIKAKGIGYLEFRR